MQKKNHEVQKGKYDVINLKPGGQAEMKEHTDDVTVFRIAKLTRETLGIDWLALATEENVLAEFNTASLANI
jgi:hypothetical protein